MLKHAFKEWAVICRVLAEGRQSLIVRKGGIAEPRGDFEMTQTRFWLFPTYLHQTGVAQTGSCSSHVADQRADRPPAGTVKLSHFVEVGGVYHVHDIVGRSKSIRSISGRVRRSWARFQYRRSGLFVLPVRLSCAGDFRDSRDRLLRRLQKLGGVGEGATDDRGRAGAG